MALTKISTDGVKDDAITKAKIPADQIEASELATDAVDTDAIQDDAVTEDKLANSINTAIAANTAKVSNATHTGDVTGSTALTIADEAVTLAKLEHGTPSNDGKYLRANNGADPTFESLTEYDDTNVRHDISVLALHFADQNNKVAFDLANSTIDPMESNASIATATDAFFDSSSEYWGTVANSAIDFSTGITAITQSGLVGFIASYLTNNNAGVNAFHTDSSGVGSYFRIDLGAVKTVTNISIYTRSGTVTASWEIQGSNDDSSFTDTGYDLNCGGGNGWHNLSLSSNNSWRYWKFYKTNGAAGGGYHAELEMLGTPTNASGSIISNTYTAPSSRSVVSGVLLYRDVSGTATLGTDIKVFFSCDNGSNYTEAVSYTALNMAFKSNVKAVTLGKTTCTAGTQIRYKVEWANQVANSKVTGCQGVALQY